MARDRLFRGGYSPVAGWVAPSLAANWADAGSGNEPSGYRLSDDKVELEGMLLRSTSTAAAGSTIFTLPTGFRPATFQYFPSYSATAGFAATGFVVIRVDASGNVSCISAAITAGVLLGIHGVIYLNR